MLKSYKLTLLILCSLINFAQAEPSDFHDNGDWSWFFDSEYLNGVAATLNDSGLIFGQFCEPLEQSCYYMVSLSASCISDAEIPALASASSGVSHITLICDEGIDNEEYRYFITPFDTIDAIIRNSNGVLGIAIGLEDGRFAVERFSLFGVNKTLDEMRSLTSDIIDFMEQNDELNQPLQSSEIL
jgi:hypothetical protein